MSLSRKLNQDVTHWPITGSDGYGGFTFGDPDLLQGRWEDRTELFINADNETVQSRAVVYLLHDVANGDFLSQGDQRTVPNPGTLSGAYRIRNYGKVTDLRAVQSLRKAWL